MYRGLPYILCVSLTVAAPQAASHEQCIALPDASNAQVLRPDVYGYSVEPSSTYAFTQSSITTTFLSALARIIGHSPPIRIGGTTADEINVVPAVPGPSHYSSSDTGSSGGNNGPASISLDPAWYSTWNTYFPKDTEFTYTLNFRNISDNWSNARQEAAAALNAIGPALAHLEFGNEVDHYISKGWRNSSWGIHEYIPQWRTLYHLITSMPEYTATKPQFQAGVIADPPAVPDQQDEVDDFSIANLTAAGLVNAPAGASGTKITSYAVHLYPQSTCDAPRRARLSLTTLSNHTVLTMNVSQFAPEARAASSQVQGNARLVLGETNSVSCGGASGVSDVFAAALWSVDLVLTAVATGLDQIFFHLGEQSEYSAFTPLAYTYKNESLAAGVRANAYAHLFLAQVLKRSGVPGSAKEEVKVKALSEHDAADFAAFAVFRGAKATGLVVLDTGVWNSTEGASNPSTLKATDSKFASPGKRPVRRLKLDTTWCEGSEVDVVRMSAPGSNAKSNVDVSGLTIDPATGNLDGDLIEEKIPVGNGGIVEVDVQKAQAVFLSSNN